MDLNEKARERTRKLYSKYLAGERGEAIRLAEEVYKEFSAAVGTLLNKSISKAVIYAGKLWIEEEIPREKAEELLQELEG